ncbi:LysO family transporter [Carboxylicivirga mesophila]|uniref:LysO family transporter n=2 Tax=Carboxylicivirga TaxID=1628153 RepID=A0A941F595_9BACT|nr:MULTISPECIES: LysO family transporter [Carboxylicivirga]MBR8535945.1 LysO family transporter [Carboxylicivirga sediminis]MBS2212897.1 LysO family transporter [Carboxylicivirga mesophila]
METLLFLCGGVLLGYLFRKRKELRAGVEKSITVMIWLLLLFLGIAIGANQQVIENIHVIGTKAMVLTFGGIAGSIACSYFVYRKFFKA